MHKNSNAPLIENVTVRKPLMLTNQYTKYKFQGNEYTSLYFYT